MWGTLNLSVRPAGFAAVILLPAVLLGQTSFPADVASFAGEQRIEETLLRRGAVDFDQLPLHEVAAALARQFDVQIMLAAKNLEEASVSPESPITKKLDDLTLESILRLVLKDLELCFVVRDEVLMITTPEDAESQLQTRVYPVLDLVASSGVGGQGKRNESRDYDSLIEIVIGTIQPDSWDEVGGPGGIDALDNAGALVISQTRDVHRKVQGLFEMLRRVKAFQGLAPRGAAVGSQRASESVSWREASKPAAISAAAWQLPVVHASDK